MAGQRVVVRLACSVLNTMTRLGMPDSYRLKAFLQTIDPADWDRDFGVRNEGEGLSVEFTAGEVVTVKASVDDLIADYDYHRAQLEELRARRMSTQPET
jgi:hypothetical protein